MTVKCHVTLALSLKIQSSREGEMTRRYTAILCRGEASVTSCCRLAMACRICWAAYCGVMPWRVVASVTVIGERERERERRRVRLSA